MSFSLAGVFGLNIYCLSLSEITLSEESLIVLFNTLPRRCIVLLEDIDSAGISRPKPPGKDEDDKKSNSKDTNANKDVSQPKTIVMGAPAQPKRLENAITISGLLNAIDGVASAEGRVLIMTTNYPDKLDDALVRPGRVDMKIGFDLASKQQIRELFLRMYSADTADSKRKPQTIEEIIPNVELGSGLRGGDSDEQGAVSETKHSRPPSRSSNKEQGSRFDSPAKEPIRLTSKANSTLEKLADGFAEQLPGGTFSPAEIQGYLLTRKKGPRKAVAEIAGWRDEILAKKNSKKREAEQNAQAQQGGASKKTAVVGSTTADAVVATVPAPVSDAIIAANKDEEKVQEKPDLPVPIPKQADDSDDSVVDDDEVLVRPGSANSSASSSNESDGA